MTRSVRVVDGFKVVSMPPVGPEPVRVVMVGHSFIGRLEQSVWERPEFPTDWNLGDWLEIT